MEVKIMTTNIYSRINETEKRRTIILKDMEEYKEQGMHTEYFNAYIKLRELDAKLEELRELTQ